MKYQSFTDALKRYESFGSINLSIYHLTSSKWRKHRECALNFIWLLCQIFHCNAWLVGVKAIPSLQLRTLQKLLDMLDGLTNLQLANRPYYFQWFVLCCIQLVGSIIIRICLKMWYPVQIPCSKKTWSHSYSLLKMDHGHGKSPSVRHISASNFLVPTTTWRVDSFRTCHASR